MGYNGKTLISLDSVKYLIAISTTTTTTSTTARVTTTTTTTTTTTATTTTTTNMMNCFQVRPIHTTGTLTRIQDQQQSKRSALCLRTTPLLMLSRYGDTAPTRVHAHWHSATLTLTVCSKFLTHTLISSASLYRIYTAVWLARSWSVAAAGAGECFRIHGCTFNLISKASCVWIGCWKCLWTASRTLGMKKQIEEFALLFLVFDENESW